MIEQLGPYRVDKMIGRGGMGTVYAGTHRETSERAAIKVLSMALAEDGNFRERFIAEIETLKQLDHPNIVRFHGDGEQDGQLFFVMELIDGQSLLDEIRSGTRFTWHEVAEIGVQICQALRHAHDRGIVHRDLKPANLLRTPDGLVKLTDFGIAKLFNATNLTAAGSIVGTADYMAPEQSDGRVVTHRADLYSLGTVLFTLLARRPPFVGTSVAQVVHKTRYEDPPPVRSLATGVPPELDRIIGQLLLKDPSERIATAHALANQLRAMQHALGSETGFEVEPGPFADPEDERPTQLSLEHPKPQTEVGETDIVGPDVLDQPPSWNNATVLTDGRVPDAPSVPPSLHSADTIAESNPGDNRFTSLDEYQQSRGTADDTKSSWRDRLSTAGIALMLVGVVAAVLWLRQPPTADALYERIVATRQSEGPEAAHDNLEAFLEQFPDDPRHNEVHGWWMDVRAEWLYSRLRIRAKREELAEIQSQYVQAMRLRKEQPEQAKAAMVELLKAYRNEPDDSEPVNCVEATKHLLKRMGVRDDASPMPPEETESVPTT